MMIAIDTILNTDSINNISITSSIHSTNRPQTTPNQISHLSAISCKRLHTILSREAPLQLFLGRLMSKPFTSRGLFRRCREPPAESDPESPKQRRITPDAGNKPFKLFFFRKKKAATKNRRENHAWRDTTTIDSRIVRNLEYELDTLFNSYFSNGDDESLDTMDMSSLSSETISACGSFEESWDDGQPCSVCTDFRQLFCIGE